MSTSHTEIAWTDRTWNVVRGCSRVSLGCGGPGRVGGCYAERQAHRFNYPGGPYEGLTRMTENGPRWTGVVRLVPEQLDEPLRWRKPQKVFVNSMSDLFHESLPDSAIDRVFAVMALARRHTFQILTKRPERMQGYFLDARDRAAQIGYAMGSDTPPEFARITRRYIDSVNDALGSLNAGLPLPNVWLGTSVEDQATADERIPLLLQTPAAVRFISLEPQLAHVDLGLESATCGCCPRRGGRWIRLPRPVCSDLPFIAKRGHVAEAGVYRASSNQHGALCVPTPAGDLGVKPPEFELLGQPDWVIVGGESGPGARPFDLAWARSAVAQCNAAGVPVFYKQGGASNRCAHDAKGSHFECFPPELKVREFPT